MKVDKSKFICELDGYNYYLGKVLAKDVNSSEAKALVSKLGEGWELPSRAVVILAQNKFQEEMHPVVDWYWLGEEYSTTRTQQHLPNFGNQNTTYEAATDRRCVRPVYKEKVEDNKPKIKLLRIAGFSDLVLDIDGEKVLYTLGDDSAMSKGGGLIKPLDMLGVWGYNVIHEDFLEWLSEQQGSKNTTSDFKKVFHIREKNEDGEVLARGGVTVVFVETDNGFATHIALCHPDDNYNKKVGVEVALSKGCYFKLPEVSDEFIKGTTPSYWRKVVKVV